MDGFTAGVLLQAANMGDNQDQVADLYKRLKEDEPLRIDEAMKAKVESLIGKRCKIKYTNYVGTIESFNDSLGGFYGGERFPYLVRIDEVNNGWKNVLFEYGEDQIMLIDE